MDNKNYPGLMDVTSGNNDMNTMVFLVRMLLSRLVTVDICQVKAVDLTAKTVDVQPMVSMVDGQGVGVAHGKIFGLPFVRLQGGSSAIICDPAVGDIGLMLCCRRDISKVKSTKAPALPGSARQFDWADGVFLGGLLNQDATQYLRMGGGIDMVTPVVSVSRSLIVGNGATGSFSTPAGQIVNVQNGIIVSIT